MKMRFNLLLISSIILCFFPLKMSANSVSGLYTIPLHSVKFETQKNFSVLPIGWSKEGNAAFLIADKEHNTIFVIIFNAVEDKDLWVSPLYQLGNKTMAAVWNEQIDLLGEKLSSFSIIPDENPLYGGPVFSVFGDEYRLFSEETSLPGNRAIASLNLKIDSKMRGVKSIYHYVHDDSSHQSLLEFQVLGYFQSPWEKRVAVLSFEDTITDGGEDSVHLKFSGSHLSIGYRREFSFETQLIISVLSGQYYNTRTLLENGVDPDIKTPSGESLLLLAAKQNNWDLVFLLIEYNGAIAVVDDKKRTLLHYGAIHGNGEAVRKLLIAGLNKNFKDVEGETALSLARKNNSVDIVGLLE